MDYRREKLNAEEMLEFYRNLDVLELKYSIEKKKNRGKKTTEPEKREKLEELESYYQFGELTKIQYGDVLENLDMVYADEQKSDNLIFLFDLVRDKIINQYIGIEGLERMFSEKYIDFEWDMHLGIDYKKHNMTFYRDHFEHQIRNAYTLHILLDKFDFCERIQGVLKNPDNSKISRYVYKYVNQQINEGYRVKSKMEEYFDKEFFYKNIIYMSCYMAALFHDIGYPEMTNIINQRRITEYVANLYNAEASGYDYLRLNALLQNSLLLRVVPLREIQARIEREKPDHGAISAVMFLMNFYENGIIQSLKPFEKCAVELAALAIYNHTNKYTYNNEAKEGEYIRNLFILNPIAYLLRLVDDLQEWGRIYFEVTNKSKLILCDCCKTPIIKRYDKKNKKWYYACNCNVIGGKLNRKKIIYPMFDQNQNFPYRRICNVTVCHDMVIDQKNEVMTFKLFYDLERLLNMSYINPNHARHRTEDLNNLKQLLDFQTDLPIMRLKYFITGNPILIKVEILRVYLLNDEWDEKIDTLYKSEQIINEEKTEATEKADKFEQITKELKKIVDEGVRKTYSRAKKYGKINRQLDKAEELYIELLVLMELHKRANQNSGPLHDWVLDKERKILEKESVRADDNLKGMVEDCLEQFDYMYQDISRIISVPKKYYKQFESDRDNYVYGCIQRFVSEDNYLKNTEGIDMYTDMALFNKIFQSNKYKKRLSEEKEHKTKKKSKATKNKNQKIVEN